MQNNIRKTLFENKWPKTSAFSGIAKKWKSDAVFTMLQYVWDAYELMKEEIIPSLDNLESNEEIERSITQLLEPRINRVMNGDEPFYVQHEVYEYETRKPAPAQPPQYDIAFILQSNPRIMWPLEAKVLKTDGQLSEYVKDLNNEFLKCRYAPFSDGGAMIGYLLSGKPNNVFTNLETKIQCKLKIPRNFINKPHRYSDHKRSVPKNKKYLVNFRCEHIVLNFNKIPPA